ncbi:MAG: hypothetical protein ABIH35_00340 [Patescibacteria group bacterium]
MVEIPPLLEYQYKTANKIQYFILSVDVALLGWTVVNTEWIPKSQIYTYLIGFFWLLIILSVIFGILRQKYDSMISGLNHLVVDRKSLNQKIKNRKWKRIKKESENLKFFNKYSFFFLVLALVLLVAIKISTLWPPLSSSESSLVSEDELSLVLEDL